MQMSITAGLLVVIIVLIRAIALNRLPKTAFLILWGVVLFRLFVPVAIPVQFSFFAGFRGAAELIPFSDTIPPVGNVGYMLDGANRAFPSIVRAEAWPYLHITEAISESTGHTFNIPIATIIWLTGMAVFFIFFAAIYMVNHRRLRFATLLSGNDFIDEWLAEHWHIRPIAVMQSDRITTPLAVGIIKPRIILPKCLNLNDKRLLSHILTHEYYHIRRLDALWKMLLVCAVCIHWFNPLVWAMLILASRDLELTCDEMVIQRLGTESRRAYAYSIIGMAQQRSKFAPLYNGFSRNAAEERIESIVKMKRKPIVILALSIVMVAALAIGTLTAFATSEPSEGAEADYEIQQACLDASPNLSSTISEPRVMRQEILDYRAYYGNDDIVGHLYIPGTTINYLIPQAADNAFYLVNDIWQRRNMAGWVWLCAYVNLYERDQNLVLFGHNMYHDHRFHSLYHFLQEDFFFSYRYIFFSTIYADYVFEVFSAYATHINFPFFFSNYDHLEGGWGFYINELARKSYFDAGIIVSENDRVITLITCENTRPNYRIVVHGRLVSEIFSCVEYGS